ncbi:MAG: hypothetical protein N3E46_13270 [Gemmataceae bacterium]|nr:hypothetical protein [Gemmataceae bacterium]
MFLAKTFSRRRRTSTGAPSAAFRRLTLERLEERDVPASIVSVVGIGDDDAGTISLEVYGSAFDDQVDIVRENNQVKVIAQGSTVLRYFKRSTSVLEQATVTYTQITFNVASIRDITITMGAGHDTARVINVMEEPPNYDYGALSVDLGSGNDSFLFSGYFSNRVASFSLDSGAGDDSVHLDQIDVRAGETLPTPTLVTGDGNDTVYLNESIVGILTRLGNGNDTLWMNACDIGRGDFSADLGEGNDILTVNNVITYVGGGYSFFVDLGNGDNQVTFSSSNSIGYFDGNVWQGGVTVVGTGEDWLIFTGNTFVHNKLNIDLGQGNNILYVAPPDDDVFTLSVDGPDGEVNTRIRMGGDNDLVQFEASLTLPLNFMTVEFADYTELDMGDSSDRVYILGARFHTLTMSLGSESDVAKLLECEGVDINVQLGNGSDHLQVTSCISVSLTVDMGSGHDYVRFEGHNTFGRFDDPIWVGGLTVWGLPGDDTVIFAESLDLYYEVNQTRVLNKLIIDLGGGYDTFRVFPSIQPNAQPMLSVDGPDGQFNTDISMGLGNDSYVVFGSSRFRNVKSVDFADKTRLDLGPGDDELKVENSTFNLLIALLGDGNDRVLNNWGRSGVRVGAESKLDGGAGTNLLPADWATPPNLRIFRFSRGLRRL